MKQYCWLPKSDNKYIISQYGVKFNYNSYSQARDHQIGSYPWPPKHVLRVRIYYIKLKKKDY